MTRLPTFGSPLSRDSADRGRLRSLFVLLPLPLSVPGRRLAEFIAFVRVHLSLSVCEYRARSVRSLQKKRAGTPRRGAASRAPRHRCTSSWRLVCFARALYVVRWNNVPRI